MKTHEFVKLIDSVNFKVIFINLISTNYRFGFVYNNQLYPPKTFRYTVRGDLLQVIIDILNIELDNYNKVSDIKIFFPRRYGDMKFPMSPYPIYGISIE